MALTIACADYKCLVSVIIQNPRHCYLIVAMSLPDNVSLVAKFIVQL